MRRTLSFVLSIATFCSSKGYRNTPVIVISADELIAVVKQWFNHFIVPLKRITNPVLKGKCIYSSADSASIFKHFFIHARLISI